MKLCLSILAFYVMSLHAYSAEEEKNILLKTLDVYLNDKNRSDTSSGSRIKYIDEEFVLSGTLHTIAKIYVEKETEVTNEDLITMLSDKEAYVRYLAFSCLKKRYQLKKIELKYYPCLLYTSPSPRDGLLSRMPSSA